MTTKIHGLPTDAVLVPLERVKKKVNPVQSFAMPPVKPSWPIMWFEEGNTSAVGSPGMVMSVGLKTIDAFVLSKEGPRIVKGIRYIHDPELKQENRAYVVRRFGFWDYGTSRETEGLIEASRKIEVLEARIRMIESNVAAILGEDPSELAASPTQESESDADAALSEAVEGDAEGGGDVEETDEDDRS